MKFEYEIYGIGCANGLIELNGQEMRFDITYQSEPLGDLLDALTNIVLTYAAIEISKNKRDNEAWFDWNGEPERYDWYLRLEKGNRLHVQIKYYKDIWEHQENKRIKGKIVMDTVVNLKPFIKMIVERIEMIASTYGIIGFTHTWDNNRYVFPMMNYIRLKNYLSGYNKILLKDKGNVFISDLRQEMKIIGELYRIVPAYQEYNLDKTDLFFSKKKRTTSDDKILEIILEGASHKAKWPEQFYLWITYDMQHKERRKFYKDLKPEEYLKFWNYIEEKYLRPFNRFVAVEYKYGEKPCIYNLPFPGSLDKGKAIRLSDLKLPLKLRKVINGFINDNNEGMENLSLEIQELVKLSTGLGIASMLKQHFGDKVYVEVNPFKEITISDNHSVEKTIAPCLMKLLK